MRPPRSPKGPAGYAGIPDEAAYRVPEAQLNRYGLAYVCEHPEILFGYGPQNDDTLDQRVYGVSAGSPSRLSENRPYPVAEPGNQTLGCRVNQAYGLLNEIYAPLFVRRIASPDVPRREPNRHAGYVLHRPYLHAGRRAYR